MEFPLHSGGQQDFRLGEEKCSGGGILVFSTPTSGGILIFHPHCGGGILIFSGILWGNQVFPLHHTGPGVGDSLSLVFPQILFGTIVFCFQMSVLVYYAKLNGFNGILMLDGKYFRKLEERVKGNLSRNLPFGKS